MQAHIIVDAHEDIAFNALTLGRDFYQSASSKRAGEGDSPAGGIATVGLPDLLRGNVRVVFGTVYAQPSNTSFGDPGRTYATPEQAEALAQEQLAYYAVLSSDPRITIITNRADLKRVLKRSRPHLGIVILMEGADPILLPRYLQKWFDAGVRIVGPSWRATRYAGGTGMPGPLTEIGRELMTELSRVGMILDTSHMSEESFFEALDLFDGTVIASHSNARALLPSDRHLTDEMIRALIDRNGVIGVVLYNAFLKKGWRDNGAIKADVTFADVIAHIQHICDLAGDASHVGIGSDFDGGFGSEATPREIDTVADLQKLADALASAHFRDDEIEGILSGNWLRLLEAALPPR